MGLLDDIGDVLTSAGVVVKGQNLFKHDMPDGPDEALSLMTYPGGPPVWSMASTRPQAEQPRFQLKVRHPHPASAAAWANDAYRVLDSLGDRRINGVRYLAVYALQNPFFLQKDPANRFLWAVNFEAIRESASSS